MTNLSKALLALSLDPFVQPARRVRAAGYRQSDEGSPHSDVAPEDSPGHEASYEPGKTTNSHMRSKNAFKVKILNRICGDTSIFPKAFMWLADHV
jgi:hypothetical protein